MSVSRVLGYLKQADIDFNLIKTKQAKINHIPKKVLSATKTFCSYIVW